MLTRDQNIIDLAYAVRWKIANPQDYVFQIDKPRETVRATAESVMREVVANQTLDAALGPGRAQMENQAQERMQKVLDDYKSASSSVGVGIKQADPPARVNDAFKDVTAAQQDAQGVRNQAQSYAKQVIARAEGEASQFDKVYEQYKLAPPSPAAACITRPWRPCWPSPTRRSSSRRTSCPICSRRARAACPTACPRHRRR